MIPRKAIGALALGILLDSTTARASTLPTRSGETGFVDVPTADVVGVPGALVGAELRLDSAEGERMRFGPLPIYVTGGLLDRLEIGLSMRQWGQPGDEIPQRTTVGAAAKLSVIPPSGPVPGIALDLVADQLNLRTTTALRVIASSELAPGLQFAAFAGAETRFERDLPLAATAGGALAVSVTRTSQAILEGFLTSGGTSLGLATRWMAGPRTTFQVAANYLPGEQGFRVSLGLLMSPRPPKRGVERLPQAPPEEPTKPTGPIFVDSRPHFRLRMAMASPARLGESRRLQYGPFTPSTAGPVRPLPPTTATKAAAPTLEELADAQVREQEALADARERRVRSTSDNLDAREKAALDEARRLEDRERDLTAREQQLDARERRIAIRGAPTQQQRQLESLEAQLAAQERQMLAQERSLVPAIDAARGRERDASTREEAERQEAARLAASIGSATTRAQQIELRKQALAARNRQLASLEARLVARGERIDALERQNRVKGERLDAWSRRLDTRSERLDLLEKRASASRPAAPKPPEAKPAGAAKDKAVFVMVVKSPTAIVKERGAAAAAPQAGTALHPGVAVEKAVAAATVVTFPTPASQLSELDRETIDNIAKLASKERCELLIWARAKDPSLMAEAQRRADEIKARAIAAGPLDAKQVVTRITTRPGAQGVDVVVSALRETARPAAAAPAAPSGAPTLLTGESGKRQLREAVQAAQPSIEACIGEHIEKKKLKRAEGSLKLSVSPQGRVTTVTTGGGDLAGTDVEECLTRASGAWTFPASDAGYVVDVPITVMRGGAEK